MLTALRNLFSPDKGKPLPADGKVTLADVLEYDLFEQFYQPKIDLKTMRLVGAEALVRARHPTRGMLGPGAFLPGASEDEIAEVLLAIAPVAGLGRVVCAAPDVAAALGYDIDAALNDPDGP